MQNWLISVAAVIILTSAAALVLPEGKTAKLIKSMFSLVCLFVILMPLKTLTQGGEHQFASTYEYELDQSFLDYFTAQRTNFLQSEVEAHLKSQGFENVEVNIIAENVSEMFTLHKVLLNISNLVILENKQHININIEIIQAAANYLNISTDKVIIYE